MRTRRYKHVTWLLGLWMVGAASCGEDEAPDVAPDGEEMGASSPDMQGDMRQGPNDPPPDMAAPQAPTWQGSWAMTASYTVTCEDALRNPRFVTKALTGSWTVQISGQNTALEAQIGPNHYMEGTGSATLLSLSGAFPLKGTQDDEEATLRRANNQVTLRLNQILSATRVSGAMSGSYETGDNIYRECKIDSAEVVFER